MSQTVDLAQLLSLANHVLTGKEYFISTVLGRLDDAATVLPHDAAIRTAQVALRRRIEKEGSLATITQKQFQSLYDDVCALGNKTAFRELLGDLLITAAPEAVAHYNTDFTASRRDSDDVLKLADDNLVGEFASLWGNTEVAGDRTVTAGRDSLKIHFASMGFGSPAVEVIGRTDGFLMFSVQADSPIGRFTTYVPVEIKQGSALMPSVFASDKGFVEMTKDNLLAYAGDLQNGTVRLASPQKLLAGLAAVANAERKELSVKTASGDEIALASPSLYQTVSEGLSAADEVTFTELPDSLTGMVTPELRDALVEAGLSYDKNVVVTAKTVVADNIRAAGLRIERLAVDSEFDSGMVISTSLIGSGGKKTIQVPVEIVSGQVLMPSVFTSGTTVESFDTQSLNRFASAADSGVFNAAFSNKSGWAYRDLYAYVIKNAAYGNFVEAEDAMAVIAEQYGPEFHRAAFTDLSDILSNAAGSNTSSVTPIEQMIAEAGERAKNVEDRIKMSSTLMYLIPED
jgi:hypothetical protein